METRKRSAVKSISWRLFGLLFTFVTAWLVTGSVRAGVTIGLADFLVKIGTFYAHERMWQRVRWGKEERGRVLDGAGI